MIAKSDFFLSHLHLSSIPEVFLLRIQFAPVSSAYHQDYLMQEYTIFGATVKCMQKLG